MQRRHKKHRIPACAPANTTCPCRPEVHFPSRPHRFRSASFAVCTFGAGRLLSFHPLKNTSCTLKEHVRARSPLAARCSDLPTSKNSPPAALKIPPAILTCCSPAAFAIQQYFTVKTAVREREKKSLKALHRLAGFTTVSRQRKNAVVMTAWTSGSLRLNNI